MSEILLAPAIIMAANVVAFISVVIYLFFYRIKDYKE